MDLLVFVYFHTRTSCQFHIPLLIQMLGKTLSESENTPKQYLVKTCIEMFPNLSEMLRQIFGKVENCQKTVKTCFKSNSWKTHIFSKGDVALRNFQLRWADNKCLSNLVCFLCIFSST